MNSKLGFLLAGRDLPMRRMMSEVVDEMGHRTIHSTPRGTDAWATLKGKGADFIISQIQLKEMDGLTFLKIVRADKEFAYTPFLLLADLVTREQVVEAGEAGVSEILCRPITPMRIAEKVEELLNPSPDEKAVLAERHYQRGLNLMDQGQYEQALEAFSAVVSVHENAEVYYNLGYISAMMEKFEDAIMYFRKATEIDRFHVKAFQKMGECFQALGDDDAAKQYLERALEIIEGDFASEDQREDILKEVRSHKSDTINIFNSLGIILPSRGQVRRGRGSVYQGPAGFTPRMKTSTTTLAYVIWRPDAKQTRPICWKRRCGSNPVSRRPGSFMSRLRGCSPIRTGRPTPEIIYPGSAQSSFNTPPTGPVLSFARKRFILTRER